MNILILIFLILFSNNLHANESPWKLRKQSQGITIYTRALEDAAILEFKSNMIIDVPFAKVITFFEDTKKIPSWYYQCIQMDLIQEENSLEKIFYFVLDLPWPVADRDSVFRHTKSEDTITGVISYNLDAIPNRLAYKKGRIRVPYLKTQWRFTPLKNGKTEIYFQQHSDPGGSLPSFLANALVLDIPFNSLKNFRKLIQKELGRGNSGPHL